MSVFCSETINSSDHLNATHPNFQVVPKLTIQDLVTILNFVLVGVEHAMT